MRQTLPILAAASLFLAGCQGPITAGPQGTRQEILAETGRQQELVFERIVADQRRINKLAFPLMKANADFCGKTAAMNGLSAWNVHSVPRQFQRAAATLYGLDDVLRVNQVSPSSPAEKAGLRSGDAIISVNGQEVTPGPRAARIAAEAFTTAGAQQSEVVISRDGKAQSIVVTPVRACDFPVFLDANNNDVNAYADGNRIVIAKGIVRFAESDNELALVIAHELAHNALEHVSKQQQNAAIGAFSGLAIDGIFAGLGVGTQGQFAELGQAMAVGQNSVAFEQEADYVGMYFMARAGYSINGVADFWRRMGAENSSSITQRGSHPSSPERFIAIDRTAAEITLKKKQGAPLRPHMAAQ